MNSTALCITVYKNRYTNMLELIKDVDNHFDVYIIAQQNDPNVNDYNQWGVDVLIPDVKSIFDKREFIRNEMIERGYEGFIMLDDDVKGFIKITEETKRTTSNSYKTTPVGINEVLHKLVDAANENKCGFSSLLTYSHLGLSKPGKVKINCGLNCAQIVYLKSSVLKEYDLHYDVSGDLNEDLDILLKLLQHGVNCCTVADYAYLQTNVRFTKKHLEMTTLCENNAENMEKMAMKITEKYHFGIQLRADGYLENKLRFKKYFNTFELPDIDNAILEFCKNKDINGLKEYLKQNGMLKRRFKKKKTSSN